LPLIILPQTPPCVGAFSTGYFLYIAAACKV
jgi:hypothetical protein